MRERERERVRVCVRVRVRERVHARGFKMHPDKGRAEGMARVFEGHDQIKDERVLQGRPFSSIFSQFRKAGHGCSSGGVGKKRKGRRRWWWWW